MDWEKIGSFIARLRKDAGLTQQELAEKIICTRESVAKWEKGINTINVETLTKIAELFDISINEILACSRRDNKTKKEVDNISAKLMHDNENKIKKMFKKFVLLISMLIILFLIYYFFQTYNSLYVYKIAGESNNFSTLDGIVIFSRNKSYLKLGTIKGNRDYDYYELYYKDKKGKEKIIFRSEDNDTLISIYGNDEYFSFKDKNEILKSTYLKIQYGDKNDVIKLNFQRDMVNSFSFFRKVNNISSIDQSNNNNVTNEDDILKIEKYVKENFSYNKEENLYILNENNSQIKYSTITKTLEYYNYNNDLTYIYEYSFIFKELKYLKQFIGKDEIEEIFTYSFENKKCIMGKCDNKAVSSFDKLYNKMISKK